MERTRKPTTPGQILKSHYIEPLGLSIAGFARSLEISRNTLSSIINGRKSVSIDIAMRLSKALGTSPELWLNLQLAVDLWEARQEQSRWENIKKLAGVEECATSA